MERMGFDRGWVDSIMCCVTTFSYTVTINVYWSSSFRPSRGLRQGDLLSPFLFLIFSEGLSSLMRLGIKNRLFQSSNVSRNRPFISHLLFAEDNILFGEATLQRKS